MDRNIFHGTSISPGVGSGSTYIRQIDLSIPQYKIKPHYIHKEINRFHNAVNKVCSQTRYFLDDLKTTSSTKGIFESQQLLLKDPLLIGEIETILEIEQCNIEWALKKALDNFSERFKKLKDSFFTEKFQDLKDIVNQLISILKKESVLAIPFFEKPTIILCDQLFISDIIQITSLNITGIVVSQIGAYSHSAILAKARGIPVIGGLPTSIVKPNTPIIMNAYEGVIISHPSSDDTNTIFSKRLEKKQIEKNQGPLTFTLKSKEVIKLQLNIETSEQISRLHYPHPTAVGLFRTEYLYLRYQGIPSLENQIETYLELGKAARDTVAIRLFDFRADKHFLRDSGFPFISESQSLDFLFKHTKILNDQLEALLIVSKQISIEIIVPMVCRREELIFIRNTIYNLCDKLKIELSNIPPLGIMLELPGTVFIIDQLADLIDFVSIGSNDLIHHALGVDRLSECSYPINNHPSLLRMVYITCQTCSRHNLPLNICGEIASDPLQVPLLIGMGITRFSVNFSKVAQLKEALSQLTFLDCENKLNQLLFSSTFST